MPLPVPRGKLHWLHVLSTPGLTRYGIHAKRGREALDALALLPRFRGELVHDGWSPYTGYTQCGHALCGAHLLRELTFLEEQYQQSWAAGMKTVLLKAKAAVEVARGCGETMLTLRQIGVRSYFILDGKISLPEAISRKVRRAAETGEFFVPVFDMLRE